MCYDLQDEEASLSAISDDDSDEDSNDEDSEFEEDKDFDFSDSESTDDPLNQVGRVYPSCEQMECSYCNCIFQVPYSFP